MIEESHTVYGVYSSVSGQLVYIGMTHDLKERFNKHYNDPVNSRMSRWCQGQKRNNLKPNIRALCVCDDRDIALEIEKVMILKYSIITPLLNEAWNINTDTKNPYREFGSKIIFFGS